MAFKTKTTRSVEIDGKAYIPEINTELRLRLGQINTNTEEAVNEAYEVIASCFPDDKEEIKSLLPKISALDIQLMRAYLIGGDTALEAVEKQLQNEIAKEMGSNE